MIMVINGAELGGGSIRIHDSEMQARVFALLAIEKQEQQEKFGFLLDALKYGCPPHGGLAFGLDRLVMLMTPCQLYSGSNCVSKNSKRYLRHDPGTRCSSSKLTVARTKYSTAHKGNRIINFTSIQETVWLGHSKWANIKHRKAAQDAKRGKIFTKIIRELVVASRTRGC